VADALLVLLVAAVCLTFAANPPKPTWPPTFSTTLFSVSNDGPPTFGRWFYSVPLNKERFDSLQTFQGQQYFHSQIIDHETEFYYSVYYQINSEFCFFLPLNGSIIKPKLSVFNYTGTATIQFVPAFVWFFNDKAAGMSYTYWDDQATREPLQITAFNSKTRTTVTSTFDEFDAGAQDPSLYILPEEIIATCNRQ